MRIAVLHNLNSGGARRRLIEQVGLLNGDEVLEFTTSIADPMTDQASVVPLRLAAPRVPAPLRPPLRYRDLSAVRRAWLTMGRRAERAGADVVFANPDGVLKGGVDLGAVALPVVRYCDEPRRVDHEPELLGTLNPTTLRLYADLRRREAATDRRALLTADRVLTNSRYTRGRIEAAYGVTAEVLSSGVPADMRPAESGPVVPAHLLSVGSLIPSKGHDLVIEAAASGGLGLPVVLVAHRGAPAEQDRLHQLARDLDVPLTIRTGITDAELADLYRHAFALLYVAAREPLGLASLEAQACGCPVIVADEGGLPETVRPDVTGFVVARRAEAVAAGLRALVEPGVRSRMAAAAATGTDRSGWAPSTEALRRHLAFAAGRPLSPSADETASGPRQESFR